MGWSLIKGSPLGILTDFHRALLYGDLFEVAPGRPGPSANQRLPGHIAICTFSCMHRPGEVAQGTCSKWLRVGRAQVQTKGCPNMWYSMNVQAWVVRRGVAHGGLFEVLPGRPGRSANQRLSEHIRFISVRHRRDGMPHRRRTAALPPHRRCTAAAPPHCSQIRVPTSAASSRGKAARTHRTL